MSGLRFLSVCSGIEAASVAWAPLGWKAWAFSEIDRFPCAVLAHHYPTTPNLGDMTGFKDWPDATVDLLCGGTPCQSFSNAGLRAGLDDPRGQLMLTFGAIAARYRPRWLVWENVPGVLSSNGGRDFGAFLGLLGFLGYGFAYRVLDAQFVRVDGYGRAVPQRRQRVFVVGCLGDWRSAAAVLLEREGLRGDPAPRRSAGARVAATLTRGAESSGRGGYAGRRQEDDYNIVAGSLAGTGHGAGWRIGPDEAATHHLVTAYGGNNTSGPRDVASALSALSALSAHGGACGRMDFETETFIAHTLRGEGFDASEDGTGRGTPLVTVLPFDTTQITSATNRCRPEPGDPCHPLAAGAHPPAIAIRTANTGANGHGVSEELAHTLDQAQGQAIAFPANLSGTQCAATENLSPSMGAKNPTAVAYTTKLHNTASNNAGKLFEERTPCLDANSPPPALLTAMQVRRLTPRECERLQGFPDDYTAIPWRGKPAAECPDGPRYKALGNSWAVNCARWIGRRIAMVDQIAATQKEAA